MQPEHHSDDRGEEPAGSEIVATPHAKAQRALNRHIEQMLRQAGMKTRSEFNKRHGIPKSTASRYANGERTWPWRFMELLMTDAEKAAGGPLTIDVREITLSLYGAVMEVSNNAELREIFDLVRQGLGKDAALSHAYYEIWILKSRLERLHRSGQAMPAEARQQLRTAELAAERLAAERHLIRAQAAQAEQLLPRELRFLDDPDLRVPAREQVPPWWPQPVPATPTARFPQHEMDHAIWPGSATPSRRAPWILIGVLLGLLGAAGIWITLLLHGTGTASTVQAAPPTAQPTPSGNATTAAQTAVPSPATPTGNPTPPLALSPSPAAPQADAPGWTAQYRDSTINVPALEGQCRQGVLDFDPARGAVHDPDDMTNLMTPDDLTIQQPCFTLNAVATVYSQVQAWGTSTASAPDPAQCRNDAMRHGMPDTVPLSKLTVGSAYCVITTKRSLAWFKVTGKPGSDQQGLTVTATLWTRNT
ncbi:hypothetical protein F7Q99_27850 [Streptomyces kaniharaensis]|uniref:Uncharacterized protein n=1 Tax=Streptomyces kaniharaensis TaxID=212423 RepID=A0A6N7L2F9_9ACTN|nr:hypothetical protein [Streptomyces kaniharaensis]MQS15963.1 hypothetical protein [Streptomyces kaniharaensis]